MDSDRLVFERCVFMSRYVRLVITIGFQSRAIFREAFVLSSFHSSGLRQNLEEGKNVLF